MPNISFQETNSDNLTDPSLQESIKAYNLASQAMDSEAQAQAQEHNGTTPYTPTTATEILSSTPTDTCASSSIATITPGTYTSSPSPTTITPSTPSTSATNKATAENIKERLESDAFIKKFAEAQPNEQGLLSCRDSYFVDLLESLRAEQAQRKAREKESAGPVAGESVGRNGVGVDSGVKQKEKKKKGFKTWLVAAF